MSVNMSLDYWTLSKTFHSRCHVMLFMSANMSLGDWTLKKFYSRCHIVTNATLSMSTDISLDDWILLKNFIADATSLSMPYHLYHVTYEY